MPAQDDLATVDNPADGRYEARRGDAVVGFSQYRVVGGRVVFLHTEVDPAESGRGVGSALVRGALDDVRARGLQIRVKCPFVAAWLERHPDYRTLIDG